MFYNEKELVEKINERLGLCKWERYSISKDGKIWNSAEVSIEYEESNCNSALFEVFVHICSVLENGEVDKISCEHCGHEEYYDNTHRTLGYYAQCEELDIVDVILQRVDDFMLSYNNHFKH